MFHEWKLYLNQNTSSNMFVGGALCKSPDLWIILAGFKNIRAETFKSGGFFF